MKKNIINPLTLKGKELHNRQLELMGNVVLTEDIKKSAIEFVKFGPDNKVYGIIRENHEYFIKVTDKQNNLVVEDFSYIGGLKNKRKEVYPTIEKARKQLKLKFGVLAENNGYKGDETNLFNSDTHLLFEHHPYSADKPLSSTKGMGDGSEYIVDKKGTELTYKSKEGKSKDGFGDNVANGDVDDDFEVIKENQEIQLTDVESRLDSILDEMSFGDDIEINEVNPFEIDDERYHEYSDDQKMELMYNEYDSYDGLNPFDYDMMADGSLVDPETGDVVWTPKNGLVKTNQLDGFVSEIEIEDLSDDDNDALNQSDELMRLKNLYESLKKKV